jgi:hypothetical protein
MNKHTWLFPSKGLHAIWEHEISGQLSDGAWENSTPHEHWKFWGHLETGVNEDGQFRFIKGTVHDYPKKKSGYNLSTLIDEDFVDLSPRMRAYYIDAELELGLGRDAEYFLNRDGEALTPDQIRADLRAFQNDYWLEKLKRFEDVGLDIAASAMQKGFDTYTKKDLAKDLREIKSAMKKVIQEMS